MTMQAGDVIEIPEGLKIALAALKETRDALLDQQLNAARMHRKAVQEMFDVVREVIPELEEWEFVIEHDLSKIAISRARRNHPVLGRAP